MRRVIIESPYAGDVERNTDYLQRCIRDSLSRGEAPFASHQMYTGALDDAVPEERTHGINAGIAWHDAADAIVVYTDLGISDGMKLSIKAATNKNELRDRPIPIEYRSLG